jgi:hypothetical protein
MPLAESPFSQVVNPLSPVTLTSMDVLFQVVVPRVIEAVGLEIHDGPYKWDGNDSGEEASAYRWGQYVELYPSKLQPWILEVLPRGYIGENWSVFEICGDGLALWGHETNGGAVEWMGRPLDTVLQLLLSVEKWVVIFEPHFRPTDHVLQCSVDECLERLKRNLADRATNQGFIAIAPASEP